MIQFRRLFGFGNDTYSNGNDVGINSGVSVITGRIRFELILIILVIGESMYNSAIAVDTPGIDQRRTGTEPLCFDGPSGSDAACGTNQFEEGTTNDLLGLRIVEDF